MLTAFYVDNGLHLPLWDRLPTLTFWLLPSAIGAPVIARAIISTQHARGHPGTDADRPRSGGRGWSGRESLITPGKRVPGATAARQRADESSVATGM